MGVASRGGVWSLASRLGPWGPPRLTLVSVVMGNVRLWDEQARGARVRCALPHHSPWSCLCTWDNVISWMAWAPSWTAFPSCWKAFTSSFSLLYNELGWNKGLQGPDVGS